MEEGHGNGGLRFWDVMPRRSADAGQDSFPLAKDARRGEPSTEYELIIQSPSFEALLGCQALRRGSDVK